MAFDDYKTTRVNISIKGELGNRWLPRFFCDDATTVYTSKAPVAKLIIPSIVVVNTTIASDVGESSHATGTIDTYDLDYGGPTNTGNFTNEPFANDVKNFQYTAVGVYEATLIVEDTLGLKSQPARVKVTVIEEDDIRAARIYLPTDGDGLYIYQKSTGGSSQFNTGLSGGHLNMVSGILNPYTKYLPVESHHYWACTDDGVVYSTDGCATWNIITLAMLGDPVNAAGDTSPPATDDLRQHCIRFDPFQPLNVYLLRSTTGVWNVSNPGRVFWYFSTDYGQTWNSKGVGG